MLNLSRAGKTLIIVFVTVFALGFAVKLLERPKVVYITDLNIPSAREIQQSLKDLDDPRYDPGKVDGIPGPDTMRGWNNLIKDRYASCALETSRNKVLEPQALFGVGKLAPNKP